ncbi:hypothetical protein [Actinomadura luteofluorescens]|uniref:hypothetical protein n=1 Tax=Actinomadura luteofluorescens TaxID=46163 RepID=UPI003D8CA325
MDPALAGLAGAAGAALVEAMTTDVWGTFRVRILRIVGRGAPAAEEELARELENSASRLSRRPPPERAALESERARWTALLAVFLVEHTEASAELQEFVSQVRRSLADAGTDRVVQNIRVDRNAFIAGRDQHFSMPVEPWDDDGR